MNYNLKSIGLIILQPISWAVLVMAGFSGSNIVWYFVAVIIFILSVYSMYFSTKKIDHVMSSGTIFLRVLLFIVALVPIIFRLFFFN